MVTDLLFFDCGFCNQFAFLAGKFSFKWTKFHAVCLRFRHPIYGWCLIDTGYSPLSKEAAKRFPFRLFEWILPSTLSVRSNVAGELRSQGIRPEEVQTLFLSHFHIDHLAGACSVPNAKIVYREDALEKLLELSPWEAIHEGFVRALLPSHLQGRRDSSTTSSSKSVETSLSTTEGDALLTIKDVAVCDSMFSEEHPLLPGLRVMDYWKDGSLYLVDLPGHALGHTGYLISTEAGFVFYIVDACWFISTVASNQFIPPWTKRLQQDRRSYLQTIDTLRNIYRSGKLKMYACHCPQTMDVVREQLELRQFRTVSG